MNIEIKKVTASGSIDVLVDGEVWAKGFKYSRGLHGYLYEFVDTSHYTVRSPNTKHTAWQVWSDKQAARLSEVAREKVEPIEGRLPKEIKAMIEAGALRSPAQCRADAEARRKRYEESERKAAEAKDRLFEVRAREALPDGSDELISRVVEAMKWAQSQ
jgi:hypothetical protein